MGVGECSTVKIMQRPLVGEEEEEDVNGSPRAQVLEGERKYVGKQRARCEAGRRSRHWGS